MIVISDVHGFYEPLMRLVEQLPKDDKIVFAGDMIDRGPQSCQVLDYIIENGHDAIKGNHEYMFYTAPKDGGVDRIWSAHGKKVCLDSFNGDEEKIARYREWARNLPLYIEYKDCVDDKGRPLVVSHTGINYLWDKADPQAEDNSYFSHCILWENDWWSIKKDRKKHDFFNIFGHSPQQNGPTKQKGFACIDGGSFIKKEGYNRLIAMQYPSMKVWSQEC